MVSSGAQRILPIVAALLRQQLCLICRSIEISANSIKQAVDGAFAFRIAFYFSRMQLLKPVFFISLLF